MIALHREYLTDPDAYLTKLEDSGYNSCHKLNSSLDATICAEKCKKLETGKFAKKCESKGGFFKCCIRRDAVFCHECR